MAIKVYGVEPDLDLPAWAESQRLQSLGLGMAYGVLSGFVASAAVGTRLVSISAGVAFAPGLVIVNDAPMTLQFPSTTGRKHLGVLQVDWSGTQDTAGTLVAIQGASGSLETDALPSVTREIGGIYQIPLLSVEADTGFNQISNNMIDTQGIRPVIDTGYIQLPLPGAWSHGNPSLSVRRLGASVVEFGGTFSKENGPIAASSSVDLPTRVIPRGCFPTRTQSVTGVADINGTAKIVECRVSTSGFLTVLNGSSSAIAAGAGIRVSGTWIPAPFNP